MRVYDIYTYPTPKMYTLSAARSPLSGRAPTMYSVHAPLPEYRVTPVQVRWIIDYETEDPRRRRMYKYCKYSGPRNTVNRIVILCSRDVNNARSCLHRFFDGFRRTSAYNIPCITEYPVSGQRLWPRTHRKKKNQKKPNKKKKHADDPHTHNDRGCEFNALK